MKNLVFVIMVLLFFFLEVVSGYQFGSEEINSSWTTISFEETFSGTPVVFTQINSQNEVDLVVPRLRGVNSTGFSVKLDEGNYYDGVHVNENISWLALETGELGEIGIRNYIPLRKFIWGTQAFTTSFSSIPKLFTQIQSFRNSRLVQVDVRNLSSGGYELRLEELPPLFGMINKELVGYLAFEDFPEGEYGILDIDSNWTSVVFNETYVEVPNVFANVNTENNGESVVVLVRNVTTAGFEMRLGEFPRSDDSHIVEEVSYLVLGETVKNIAVVSTSSSGVSYIVSTLDDAGHNVTEIDSSEISTRLNDFDLLIYPGSSDAVYDYLGDPSLGRSIQNFVDNGGGFIGICGGSLIAGDYLYYDGLRIPMMGLLNVNSYEYSSWVSHYVGSAVMLDFLVSSEHEILEDYSLGDVLAITYAGGPIFTTSTEEIILEFDEDLDASLTSSAITGSAAVVVGEYGDGKVVLSSPHPEYSNPELLLEYVDWATS